MGAATHIMAATIRVAALLLFSACVCNGASMRAAVGLKATPAGDFSQIALHSVPIPECCADTQVLVRAKASSVNPVDWKIMEASAGGSVFPITFPHIPGFDCAGEVIQSGAKSSWKPGDLVWGMSTGAFAEYVVLESSALGHKPESMSMGDAAALGGVAGLTSLQSLQQTGAPWPMKNGTDFTVVITSGAGGTGIPAIQMAKAFGATRVVTSASKANIELLKSLGADVVIDYHKSDIWTVLGNDTVDVVYDNFGAVGTADKAMSSMKAGGVFIFLPGKGGALAKHPKAGVKQINYGILSGSTTKDLDTLKGFVDAGKLKSQVQQSFDLAHVAQAFNQSFHGHVVGKLGIVC